MFNTIIQATQNFCIHQIRQNYEQKDEISQKRTLIAYIDIDTKTNQKYRVYIAGDTGFFQRVAKLFLEEDESDEETLIDISLETANLIIGSAKVISQEEDIDPYTIQTPHFEKIGLFDFAYDQAKTITVEDTEITIAIKELNA
jgi:hypothetical protein